MSHATAVQRSFLKDKPDEFGRIYVEVSGKDRQETRARVLKVLPERLQPEGRVCKMCGYYAESRKTETYILLQLDVARTDSYIDSSLVLFEGRGRGRRSDARA